MDTIGGILKQERERRGLSVQEAYEATKITVQSITAIEGDRFESFPNKVYARAFLRDYANYLGLDSAALLTAYEEKWSATVEPEPVVKEKSGKPALRALGYSLLILVIVGILAVGSYFAFNTVRHKRSILRIPSASNHAKTQDIATMPKAPSVTPPKPEAAPKSAPAPKPQPAVVAQKAELQVTALLPVWVQIKADDKTVFMGTLAKGQTQTFEGKKTVFIKAGMAGAVQLKFNGQTQPPLGSYKVMGKKTFTLPATPSAPPAPETPGPASSPSSAH